MSRNASSEAAVSFPFRLFHICSKRAFFAKIWCTKIKRDSAFNIQLTKYKKYVLVKYNSKYTSCVSLAFTSNCFCFCKRKNTTTNTLASNLSNQIRIGYNRYRSYIFSLITTPLVLNFCFRNKCISRSRLIQ